MDDPLTVSFRPMSSATFGWVPHHVADPDIRLGEEFNMVPSISRVFFVEGGSQSIAKLDAAMAGYSPGSATVCH